MSDATITTSSNRQHAAAAALERTARLAVRLLRADGAVATVVDGRGALHRAQVDGAGRPAELVGAAHERAVCRLVAAAGAPMALSDVAALPDATPEGERLIVAGIRALAGVPLRDTGGDVCGALCVVTTRTRDWSADDLAALADLADAVVPHSDEELDAEDTALANAKRHHRELLDALPLVVYSVHPEPPYLPVYLSRSVEGFGWPVTDWYAGAVRWVDILHPDDCARALREVEEAKRRGETVLHEYRVVDGQGAVRWVHDRGQFTCDATGRLTAWHGVMMDVTAQREAERAAHGQEERFRSTLENLRAPALTLDVNGHVTYANGAMAELLGYGREELLGVDWFERFVWDQRVASIFADALASGTIPAHYENEVRTRSGEMRLVAWDNVVLRDTEGRIVGTSAIGHDVGERRRLEDELRQAQKMEAVGRLAGGIAHDFNNILTAIGGAAEFLSEEIGEGHPAREDLEQVRAGAARAGALTRQLLAFSRKQILQPRVLDLNATVQGLEGFLARLIGEDVHVATHLAPNLGPVRADPGQLEQVLVNLAVNARDAMPRGGVLTIETGETEVRQARGPSAEPPHDLPTGRYVRLVVRDTGVGMSAEVLERAFEPFFTTKPQGKGTGLGLATVFGIVKQSGGTVTAESAPGEGASFAIWLPCVGEASPATTTEGVVRVRGTETVLLVEDESAVRTLARRVLEREGYAVLEARHGRDALRIVDEGGAAIDLVVSDAVMPEMDGPALVRALTARGRALPVLLMSGYTDDEVVRRGACAPGLSFLPKPFTARELSAAVRRVLDEALYSSSNTS